MITQKYEMIGNINDHKKIVKNEKGKICYLKILDNYNLSVFAWLKEHRNEHIPTIIEYEEKENQLEVVESYIEGVTLEQILKHDISIKERKELFFQILDGISFLHHASPAIIHRDIKTTNIMIDKNNVVKIIDYDAAKIYQKNEPRDTVLLGTEGVAAPEQYGFGASDTRTDIYALGILMRTMFPDELNMLEIADICTQLKPEDRFQSVEDLKKAIIHKHSKKITGINIPGFREGKLWHMILAIVGYVMIYFICFTGEVTVNEKVVTNQLFIWLYRFDIFFMCLGWLDIFTSWTGIFNDFPWIKDHNIIKRIIGYTFACMCVAMVAGLVQGLCEVVLGVS